MEIDEPKRTIAIAIRLALVMWSISISCGQYTIQLKPESVSNE